VRISKTLADSLKVGVGRRAEIAVENGALVLRPIKGPKRKPTYTLEELLRGMTKAKVPQEVDWANHAATRPNNSTPIALTSATSFGSTFSSHAACAGAFTARFQ
jgi:antitoxin component of MazEF toxin-antitoxin module